jgi:acetylornithine deacetylase/succinyl-diaminopimelate desuccinylase-like protein
MDAMDSFDETAGIDPHDTLGPPTLTPTTIEGGEAFNRIPDRCLIGFDRRSVPPEDPAAFDQTLEAHLRANLPGDLAVSVTLSERTVPHLQAFATDTDDPLVDALADASGGAVRPFGAATEASFFAATAPTVVFGPGDLADDVGGVAHAEREYVRLESIYKAAAAVTDTVSRLV